uniref:Uncharacterized protein n=1 Tax=Junco hyemalis TaxID=40217 RepID=A0A8C5NPB5_JUNHY
AEPRCLNGDILDKIWGYRESVQLSSFPSWLHVSKVLSCAASHILDYKTKTSFSELSPAPSRTVHLFLMLSIPLPVYSLAFCRAKTL